MAALVLTAAYQVRPTYRIAMGDTAHDTALVQDFYGPERQLVADGGARYRWTRGRGQITFPGIGRGAVALDLLLTGSTNPNPETRVLANGTEIATLHLTPDFRPYRVAVPASLMAHGTLELTLVSTPFTPRGDRRVLGIVVQEVTIHPVGGGFALPPARITLSFWLAAVGVALAFVVAGFGGPSAFAGATVGPSSPCGSRACFIRASSL
ncbi:MAG: hypothetical protein LC793_06180 [Thermomicrobia bacterium]|nr:hypothetical protein [Thermomicrobia bacterium]